MLRKVKIDQLGFCLRFPLVYLTLNPVHSTTIRLYFVINLILNLNARATSQIRPSESLDRKSAGFLAHLNKVR